MDKKPGFTPPWTETPPPAGSFRSIFKWGSPDAFKHPNQGLYEMMKERFGLKDDDFRARSSTGDGQVEIDAPIRLAENHVRALERIAGEENVAVDVYSRVKYSTGKTTEELLRLRGGTVEEPADVVVHPRGAADVREIVSYCDKNRLAVYIYGGGSSVTLGLSCPEPGVTLVLGAHMNRILDLNETNQTVTVQPGVSGPDLEKALEEAPERFGAMHRYTCGHFPQSFEYSSVGGWIATLGSGQSSTYYGDIYDIVLSQEYVTPAGAIKTLDYPATATGPKVNDILKGNEGTFGVLVSATLKIFRSMPANRFRFSFMFPTWEGTVDAAREICQSEFGLPSVLRISDSEETEIGLKLYGVEGTVLDRAMKLRGLKPGGRCLVIGHTEGERGFSRSVHRKIRRICRRRGAMYLTGYPVKKWEHGRFRDPYMREDLNDFGIVLDTLESGVTWDNLHNLHAGVRKFVKSRPGTVCMTHASHFYPQGTNLYFIFIAKMDTLDEYRSFQSGIIDAIEKHGGSLSHHHGVGRMIAPWMERHLGSEQMAVLRALKRHFDPNGIMNPGSILGLDSIDSA